MNKLITRTILSELFGWFNERKWERHMREEEYTQTVSREALKEKTTDYT
jgi:hypothetical protein